MNSPPLALGDAPITQAALDRLEQHVLAQIAANDQRYEQRFLDSQKAVDAALQAAEKAVSKAEMASEKRFEGLNEFRSTLSDQQRTLMPRSEAEMRINANEARITAMERTIADTHSQKTGGREAWAYIVAAIGVVLAILSFIFSQVQ